LAELAFPGLNRAYLAEQLAAAEIVGALRPLVVLRAALFTAPELLAAGVLPLAMLLLLGRLTWLELLYFAALLLGSLVLLTQAAQGFLLVTPLAIAVFALTRALASPPGERQRIATTAIVIGLGSSVMMLLMPAAFSIARHAKDARAAPPLEGLPAAYARLRVPHDVDLARLRRSFEGTIGAREAYLAARGPLPLSRFHSSFPSEYLASLVEMGEASKACGARAARAAVLDFTNMAPSFLGQAPSSGYVYMHFGRSFTPSKHPAAERMFVDVGCLLDPKLPIEAEARDAIWAIYGEHLRSRYRPAGETTFWRVLVER
jgi:hypothetical protein